MIIQTKRKSGKCISAAHAAGVDDDGDPHGPDSERRMRRLNPNPETSTSKWKAANPTFDELDPWVDYMVRAEHKTTCWEQIESRRGSSDREGCWKQAIRIARHHDERWTKLRTGTQRDQPSRNSVGNKRKPPTKQETTTISRTTHLAHHGTDWLEVDSMEKRHREQQTQTTSTTHDPHHHRNDNQPKNTRTNNIHD